MDLFDWMIIIIKLIVVLGIWVVTVPVMTWIERRGAAFMQKRLGPNRVGPLGLFQVVADAIKMLWKEDVTPGHVNKFYFTLAPVLTLIPALMTFAVIPFAGPMKLGGYDISFQVADLNMGVLYVLAIGSLGIYGFIMAGWSSNNKYAILGSLRSSAQMISYSLSLGLSIIGIVMAFSSVELGAIAAGQGQSLFQWGAFSIPRWGIFIQPLGCLLFIAAIYAETNRLPFDLPEGDPELVAGYHLEYSSMRFALFYMAEYLYMTTASALIVAIFFGGWQMLPGMSWLLKTLALSEGASSIVRVAFELCSFALKTAFFLWLYIWVRWTLPRFRYDQLMSFGWKVMFPLGLLNVFITAVLVYYGVF